MHKPCRARVSAPARWRKTNCLRVLDNSVLLTTDEALGEGKIDDINVEQRLFLSTFFYQPKRNVPGSSCRSECDYERKR
jgi:hypothetical protein